MSGVCISRIDRKSSLDTEPRTLNFRQIDIAREAALYVMHTRSREEACQIFTEGLEPVETPRTTLKWGEYSEDEEEEEEEFDEYSSSRRAMKQEMMKDVLTAPF